MRQIVKSKRLLLFLTTLVFMLYGFGGMFFRVRCVFADPKEDMSFGWLVPFFSAYVLWTERRELVKSVGKASWLGLLACVPLAAVSLLGTRGLQVRLEQLGFIGLCIAVPWAFFGLRTARLCVFPALYLLFTVPMSTFLDVVTIHLRLLASGTAFAVLKGFGVQAVQQGTAVIAQGAHSFNIDVAEPCSGLRSLVALMALTAAYAWHTQPTWWRRAVLFACSIPLAVLGNVVRILTICLCAAWGSPDFAMGFYHDYSGYIVFIVAIICMVACGELVTRLCEGRAAAHGGGKPAGEVRERSEDGSVFVPALATVFLAAAFVFQSQTPVSTITSAPEVVLPESIPGYRSDRIFYCHNEQCARAILGSHLENGQEACPLCGGELAGVSLGEKTILPSDTTILKRVYRTPYGVQFLVSAVIGGKSKQSIHRPELCMPAQGYTMSNPRNFDVAGHPFHAVHLAGAGSPPSVLAYTFVNQDGVRTASHTRRIFIDTWDRTVHNRVDRWVMVTVNASDVQSGTGFDLMHEVDRHALEDFLARLVEALP